MHTPRKKETLMMFIKKEIRKEKSKIHLTTEKESNYLETTTKIINITIYFAITAGGITTFIYLNSIQHPSIFTEAISNPYSFAAILIAFGILFLLIFAGLITPYAIILEKPQIPIETWRELLSGNKFNILFKAILPSHITYFLLIGFLGFHDVFEKAVNINHLKYLISSIFLSPFLFLSICIIKDKTHPHIQKNKKTLPHLLLYTFKL